MSDSRPPDTNDDSEYVGPDSDIASGTISDQDFAQASDRAEGRGGASAPSSEDEGS